VPEAVSLVHTIAQLIEVTKRVSPKAKKSALWRRAAEKAIREATAAEYDGDAREGPPEEEECITGDSQAGFSDLSATLDGILPKPRTSTSKSTRGKTNVVSLTRSDR
jgi:hypothetical protein